MSRITVCPHYLVDYNLTSPDEIMKEIIKPLYECLSECNSKNIQLVLSKDILDAFELSWPWDQSSDPLWSGHLRDWYYLISPNILKADIIKVPAATVGITPNCSLISATTTDMFARFLAVFGSQAMHSGLNEEGIFINTNCAYPVQLQKFCYVINPIDDLVKVIYPWLRIYNRPLPYDGDYPFIPPTNWRNFSSPIKGTLRGYLDDAGNSWEWDRMHDDHWDVQHSCARDDYTNISPDGRVLDD